MAIDPELVRLLAPLDPGEPADPQALKAAGEQLGFAWPDEYLTFMSRRNGCDQMLGEWWVVVWPVETLVENNRGYQERSEAFRGTPGFVEEGENYPGVVFFGGNGGGEGFAFDRETGDVLLVPWIGDRGDWIRLGSNLVEALQAFERDDVFDNPVFPYK